MPGCHYPTPPIRRTSREGKQVYCDAHHNMYRQRALAYKKAHGVDLDVEMYEASRAIHHLPKFRTGPLPGHLTLEVYYALQQRHDDRTDTWRPDFHTGVVNAFRELGVCSLLELSRAGLVKQLRDAGENANIIGFARFAWDTLKVLEQSTSRLSEYDRDRWRWRELGYAEHEVSEAALNFEPIQPEWLQRLAKRWARLRLDSGKKPSTVAGNVRALGKFCADLLDEEVLIDTPEELDRDLLEDYLSLVKLNGYGDNYRLRLISGVGIFLDDVRRNGWEPRIPPDARYYHGELPRPTESLPRFIPEFVMEQIESESALSQMSDFTAETILRVLIATGLRASDALRLPLKPISPGRDKHPYLKFVNNKFSREKMIPVSDNLAERIFEQARLNRETWPTTPWLFPRLTGNPDGSRAYSYGAWKQRLTDWLGRVSLVDEAGDSVRVSSHQFRHTVGTRMVNAGVAMETVKDFLDHSSLQMTERYARIHNETLRNEWLKSENKFKVIDDIVRAPGTELSMNAEWMLTNIQRAKQSLPNGYCARPLQAGCPHSNACLPCGHFRSTKEFIPLHKGQLHRTNQLIAKAEAEGKPRIADLNRPIIKDLERIIATIEEQEGSGN